MKPIAAPEIKISKLSATKYTGSSVIRLFVGYTAVAIALPYILLKIAWLTGSAVGMRDPAFFENQAFVVGNAVILVMDVLAIFLALALTHSWGKKIPAKVILFPV